VSATGVTNLACPQDGHRDEEKKPKGGTHLGYLNDFLAQFYGFFEVQGRWFELLLIEGCLEEKYTITLTTILLSPENEGRVVVTSADARDQATIDFNPTSYESDIFAISSGLQKIYVDVRRLFIVTFAGKKLNLINLRKLQ
jgi:hypothetical protein